MKRSVVLILIFGLLIFPIISAVDVEMKTNFTQGETLLAKVSGNFLEPILKENIFFYKGHRRMPMEFGVSKINQDFYIYALLPEENPNNYSLTIKDVKYMKGSQISEEEITKEFSISEVTADFSINPGFIISTADFYVEVQNLRESKITINYKSGTGNETTADSIDLLSGEIKKINFEADIDDPVFKTIEISTENLIYEIPVYLYLESEAEAGEKRFAFDPHELNFSLPTNSNSTRIITLYNTGERTIRDISLSVSETLKPYANISINEIEKLEKSESVNIEVYLFSEKAKTIEGSIKAQTPNEELLDYSEFYLEFLDDYTPSDIAITKTCAELNGTICSKGTKCEGEQVNTKDNICCIGECKEITKSPAGMIIGIALIVIIVSFLAWFIIKKYYKPKKPVDLLKVSKVRPPIRNRPSQVERFKALQQKTPIPKREIKPVQHAQKPLIKYVEKPVIKEVEKIVEKPVIKEVERIVEKPIFKEIEKKVLIAKPRQPAPPRFKYKASTTSKTVHKVSCRLAKLIKKKYKLTNNSLDYFKKRGYKPCKVCLKK